MLSILRLMRNKSKREIETSSNGDELNHRKIPELEQRLQDVVSLPNFV